MTTIHVSYNKIFITNNNMQQYYILKQFLPDTQIWVAKLNADDPEYVYNTLAEAEAALPDVQLLYPNNLCKVGDPITIAE